MQFDGSEHKWFLNIVTDLLLIDDATGKIIEAEFFYGETSNNVMKVLKDILQNNGIPDAFYFAYYLNLTTSPLCRFPH